MWSWTSVRNLVTSMNSSGTNLDHACDRNTHARRRRAEKMVFYGYMVNFGASQGTLAGGGVGRGGVSKICAPSTSVSRFSGHISPMG